MLKIDELIEKMCGADELIEKMCGIDEECRRLEGLLEGLDEQIIGEKPTCD